MTQDGARLRAFADEVDALLHTRTIGRTIRAYGSVASTNTVASEWAQDGAPHGAVVFAEYQQRGRGRQGRTWEAQPGLNLTFSVILRPEIKPELWGLVTISAGVAVSDALSEFVSPIRPALKWPNDVLLSGRKCCGMLLESNWPPKPDAGAPHVVLGVGVNVHQVDFPAEFEERATSILLETGRRIRRVDLLTAILDRLEARLDQVRSEPADVKRAFMARMVDLNEPVELRYADQGSTIQGTAIGLDEAGGLILQTDAGPRAYHAGEVTRSR